MPVQENHQEPFPELITAGDFESLLNVAIVSVQAMGARHALCYLDVNGLQAINAAHGRGAGDWLLSDFARIMTEAVPDSARIARLGGDEFGIVLIDGSLETARRVANNVACAVAEHRTVWADQLFRFSVAIGVVEINSSDGSVEDVLRVAKAACSDAKVRGIPVHPSE